MSIYFRHVMRELGSLLNLELVPNHTGACVIKFNSSGISIQLEPDSDKDILAAVILGPIEEGSYRDRIFKTALLINGKEDSPLKGKLGFGEVSNQLYMFELFPLEFTTAEVLLDDLRSLSDHALIWKNAIDSQDLPRGEDIGIS